jgi:hypothetical protein
MSFFSCLLRFSVAAILLVAYASAFAPVSNQQQQRGNTALNIIPITNGPTLNSEQAKAAGIGGLNGTTNLKSGGLGAFGVAGSSGKKNAAKKSPAATTTAKKGPAATNAKKAPAKKPAEAKKSVNLFTKMPWSK